MIVIWNDTQFECSRAVKYPDRVIFYNENNQVINSIFNITEKEWKNIHLQNGDDIPTEEDYLRADIDFLTMENDALRADLDFVLTMLNK